VKFAVHVGLQLMPAGELVTVPVPVPASVIVSATVAVLNVAVTAFAAFIVTTHPALPVQAPFHRTNVEPSEAVGVSVTCVPLAKFAAHVSGQLIPVGALVTVPCPVPASATVNAKLTVPKLAITVVAAVIKKVQVLVPSQAAPPHPVNVEPDAGVAVKVI